MDQARSAIVREVSQALSVLLGGTVPPLIFEPVEEQEGELRDLLNTTNLLIKKFAEAQGFLSSLSEGILEVDPPAKNFLISPFKRLHSNLRHLTWQTKQVAVGDLGQHVDFLGEFSSAFNTMIASLREKRELERALKRSEERLALAVDGADLGLWDYDVATGEVIFNKRWADMLEYRPEEIEQSVQFWHDLIHPQDKGYFEEAWEAHLENRTPTFRVEHRLRSKSGNWKWTLCMGRIADTTVQGQPSRVAGILIDITDRKAAEAELQEAHASLLEANTEIMDSIRYARSIQMAFLPNAQEMASTMGEHFIIWKPKDVIGGDIYKFKTVPEGFVLSVMDCTGHSVPGAIMTMISGASFDRAMEEVGYKDPALLLKQLNRLVKRSLNQHYDATFSDDGLDIGICFVNRSEHKLVYAGARIGLWCLGHGTVSEIPADRQSIGYKSSDLDFPYLSRTVSIDREFTFYLSSDGMLHQTGGPRQLPFGKKRFKRLLLDCRGKPLCEQTRVLEDALQAYSGDEPQLDDITIVGFKAFITGRSR